MLSAACGILRASANIRPMASSAAAAALPCGVLMTRMPFSVAALTSMLSTPTPARPMIFRLARVGQRVRLDLAGRADADAVVLADHRRQLLRLHPGLDVDRESRAAQDLDGLLGHVIGDENANRLGHGSLPLLPVAALLDWLRPPGLGERRLCRRHPGARPNAEAEIGQRHLQPRDGGDDVELAHVPDVSDADDLPLQVILAARDRDAVARRASA